MNEKDYLILTKGRAVCLMLNSARCVLSEMVFEDNVSNVVVKECDADLLDTIVQVATLSCGCDEWPQVYSFLVDVGISIPDDVNYKMMYMESIADLPPSENRNN